MALGGYKQTSNWGEPPNVCQIYIYIYIYIYGYVSKYRVQPGKFD